MNREDLEHLTRAAATVFVRLSIHAHRFAFRLIAYAWAAPNTVLGLATGLVMLSLGGRLRFVAGVAEFHGGWLGRIVARLPESVGFGAMTLGHVIVGIDQATLRVLREHEQVHVRQYEQWGLFFLPAYVLSSFWQVVNGRSAHGSNFFERQACAVLQVRQEFAAESGRLG